MLRKLLLLFILAVHNNVADLIKAYSDIDYQASGAEYLRWTVEVYRFTDEVPENTCGGSLVKPAVVISAARCFWDNGELPASQFAVARTFGGLGIDTPWNSVRQKSEVSTIHLPPTYRDRAGLYADDIAVLTLVTPILGSGVMPICVSFDEALDRGQLVVGNYGRNMGTLQGAGNGLPSPLFTALEVPYASKERCANESDPYYREQLTPDKICVGFKPGPVGIPESLVCRADHGSGLAFYSGSAQAAIPYLRGVASTPFPDPSEPLGTISGCSTFRYAAFTHIASQRAFLELHIPDIEKTCSQYYGAVGVDCNCVCNNN